MKFIFALMLVLFSNLILAQTYTTAQLENTLANDIMVDGVKKALEEKENCKARPVQLLISGGENGSFRAWVQCFTKTTVYRMGFEGLHYDANKVRIYNMVLMIHDLND